MPFFLIAAIFTGTATAVLCARRDGLPLRRIGCVLLLLGAASLGGAKLHSLWERGGLQALGWEMGNGYRYPGAMIGWLAAVSLWSRVSVRGPGIARLADALAPSFAFAIAVSRLGCFFDGCCTGGVCSLPWAVRYPAGSPAWIRHVNAGLIAADAPSSLPLHPLQIYFLLLCAGVGLLLLRLQRRKSFDGQVILTFIAAHAGGKSALEILRAPPAVHVQLASLLFALAAGTALLFLRWRRGRHDTAVVDEPQLEPRRGGEAERRSEGGRIDLDL